MTYAQLMAKLKKGEALTNEEVAMLEKVSRPAERFNEVSAKAQKLEADLKAKTKELEDLEANQIDEKQRLEDEVKNQLAELSGKVETLSLDNQKLKEDKAGAERLLKIKDLARDNPTGAIFNDPNYLAYLLDKKEIDLEDDEQVKSTFESLLEKHPEQFNVVAKGGSGSGAGNQTHTDASPVIKGRDDFKTRVELLKQGLSPEEVVAKAAEARKQE